MRAPRLPRCGVCDALEVVLHCQQCDEPTCSTHVQRVFVAEGVPPTYLCALCVEERATPAAEAPSLAALSALCVVGAA